MMSLRQKRNYSTETVSVPEINLCALQGDIIGITKELFEAESKLLAEIPETLDPVAMERAIEALTGARRVYFYGVGSCGLLASDAEYRFARLGMNCVSLQNWMQMAIQTSVLSSRDVVVAFSHTGRDRRTVESLGLARQRGATTIGVVGEADSPLLTESDVPLVFPSRSGESREISPTFHIGVLTLLNALATCVATRTKRITEKVNRCDEHIEMMMLIPNLA